MTFAVPTYIHTQTIAKDHVVPMYPHTIANDLPTHLHKL